MKPSRAGVQVMAHSTEPGTPNFGLEFHLSGEGRVGIGGRRADGLGQVIR
jgi:hypothetical protein